MSQFISQDAGYSSALEVNKVLRNTYMLLGMTLLFSAIMAGVTMAMEISHLAALGMSLGAFVTIFILNKTAESASGIVWVFVLTGLLGGSLGPMLNMYAALPNGSMMIMQALGGTAVIFFGLSAYALTTKKDFSFMRGFLMVGLLVAVIAGLANLFFQVPAVHLAINAVIVMLMSGFILYDTSRIINGGETNYIRATVGLYLNIYNLFVSLLQLIGAFSSDD